MSGETSSRSAKQQRRAERRAAELAAQRRSTRLRRVRRAGAAVLGAALIGAIVWAMGNEATVDVAPVPADLAADGASLYEATCAECHGSDLRGTEEGPSFFSSVYNPNHHSDESFRRAVQLGSPQHHWPYGDMPAVEGLTDEDISAIIAFVRDQQRIHGFDS